MKIPELGSPGDSCQYDPEYNQIIFWSLYEGERFNFSKELGVIEYLNITPYSTLIKKTLTRIGSCGYEKERIELDFKLCKKTSEISELMTNLKAEKSSKFKNVLFVLGEILDLLNQYNKHNV